MKTAKEWFEQLPEPIRTQAKENSSYLNDIYSNLAECLQMNFGWSSTIQGHTYWSKIRNRAQSGEFNQPTPNIHGWIPVGERLPTEDDGDENSDVMVLDRNGLKSIARYYWVKINITHWQPLPKLPEVKNGK